MEISELHKQATALKSNGDLSGAVALLKQAKPLMQKSSTSYPIESWLRLPLFLQQAGSFEEAMVEFEELLADLPIKRDAGHVKADFLEMLTHAELCTIYDKMRLACDREYMGAKAREYEKLSAKHDKEWEKLNKKINR